MYFNANEVEIVKNDFEPLPNGNYTVLVDSSEEKLTKTGTGKYVKTTLQVIGGSHAGRKIFNNFNIQNQNEKAQQIGRSDFAKFLKAVNTPQLKNLEEVVGKTLVVTVATQKNKTTGEDQNVIKSFSSVKNFSSTSKVTDDHPFL